MEIHQIRYFLALAETLNFTRAAEACHVTQPALTRAIQALEAELGGPLIRREGRTSHLTDLGVRMRPLLQRCHDSAQSAKDLARAAREPECATVRAMLSHTIPIERMVDPLCELLRVFPKAELRMSHGGSAEIEAALKAGEIDLAVAGPIKVEWERIDSWPLETEGFAALGRCDDPALAQNIVAISALAGEPLVSLTTCESRDEIAACLGATGVVARRHEVLTQSDAFGFVAAGFARAIVPDSAPTPPGLKRAAIRDLPLRRTVSAYTVAGRPRPAAASALLALLRTGRAA